MNLKTFLNFTRIQTLPAGLMAPIAGVLFALYRFQSFHLLPTLLFFIGMIAINLFVSAWNNLMDFYKAKDPDYKARENIIANRHIKPSLALKICLLLLAIDLIVGIWVVCLTNLAILPVGGIGFLIAVFYTYGPFAFSRFPLGEVLAGLCEGAIAFFMALYVNSYQANYFNIHFHGWLMNWRMDWAQLFPIILIALGCFCQNFNVMFADNICDLDQDVRNERFTLPWYLKIPRALKLFPWFYVLSALTELMAIFWGILPLWSLIILLTWPFVFLNVRKFLAHPDKHTTFGLSVRNLMLYNGALALGLLLGVLSRG
ncbi:MAG: UbiA family prenyltransferase [Streptococcaceae bacterium]|jgi:1,4-dihydroxy-2-naphthoate octaprenyltransferase|nr:UbiA family prenyltransferase [Streptococcaceae bacterium]